MVHNPLQPPPYSSDATHHAQFLFQCALYDASSLFDEVVKSKIQLFKACAFALLVRQVLAYPTLLPSFDNLTQDWNDPSLHKRQHLYGSNLRFLPFGASITAGEQSSDGCGYRKPLREALRWANYKVDMVGSRRTGINFMDNDHEGWGGYTINQVKEKGQLQYRLQPNLVLVNAGTNNCRIDATDAKANGPSEMEEMVLDIFTTSPTSLLFFQDCCLTGTLVPATRFQMMRMNGDGRDDFICIGPEGNMYVSLNWDNLGEPRFQYLGLYFENPRPGSSQTHVRLGDIDGDGRLDYCLTAGNGDISCWRNGGNKNTAEYWQALGVVFTGKNTGNIGGIRLVDINGDHRSDWLYVNDDGSVDIYINNRGHDKSLRPDWSDRGRTHAGIGEKGARDYIDFPRNSAGSRADYIWQNPRQIGNSVSRMQVDIRWWRNDGSGGTMLQADGNNYCDMTGDGVDDYIWVSSRGDIQIFRNVNNPPIWGQHGWYFIRIGTANSFA
ncbi:hypothetical protein BDW59DRAFT_164409 [Aspergillus cavernicola]|uniref:Uncharacterized protein n=1 Tax=Aspergillus cavernicola TaxID=176166 RepID=A0ABR4HZT2_9EURO